MRIELCVHLQCAWKIIIIGFASVYARHKKKFFSKSLSYKFN